MEIKTTQQITGRLTRPSEKNIKWVAVDDIIELFNKITSEYKSQSAVVRFMKEIENLSTSLNKKHTDVCIDANIDKELQECICEEPSPKSCPECKGSGLNYYPLEATNKKCHLCNGTGKTS